MSEVAPVLAVEALETTFMGRSLPVRAVDGISFEVYPGETLGIVGESGSGKSMTALSILRLVPETGRIVGGRVMFCRGGVQRDVLGMTDDEIRHFRGGDVAMVFQDPMTSLNPTVSIGLQIEETMAAHDRYSGRRARARTVELLRKVHIPAAERRVSDYPHQLSGGMRQRVMIAMALANDPAVLLADEPTTALDVTVQAQIIDLLRELNRDLGTAIVLITHNLAVVASLCTRVIVMYAGRIVEEGTTRQVFKHPQHPYTWSLLRSIPRADMEDQKLLSIAGLPPDLARLPAGCKFHPRCRFLIEKCQQAEPSLDDLGDERRVRCWVLMRNVPEKERI